MTFSIVARCPATGMFGVAVCSSSPAVGARCGFARARVGAAASQNLTDPALGEALLDAMARGQGAQAAMDGVTGGRAGVSHRQLLAVDAQGGSAAFTGSEALGVHAQAKGPGVAAAGNLLADRGVPAAMVAAFEAAGSAGLGERILDGMGAGLAAGGEAGPVHSIGLKIVDRLSWPLIDLRIDWADGDLVARLKALYDLYAPDAAAYVRRALEPGGAPSFGVPGDP